MFRFTIIPLISLCLLGSCTVGPNHVTPDVSDITPATWKWQPANPRDHAPRGNWWTVFNDRELNRLESLATHANQDLRAALARVDQARATAGVTRMGLVPDVQAGSLARRERTSGNPPSPVPVTIPSALINSFNLSLDLNYELDLWGRVRRSIESANAEAEAVAADYQSVLLTLTGDVAVNYFQLRAFDSELLILHRTEQSREKSYALIQQRFAGGLISEVDPARAMSALSTTRAEIADAKRQREELVSVLALLCGQPASTFTVSEQPLHGKVPVIPAGLPASLLERRPDIAAAERLVAARSADIGVNIAGYFPVVSLTGAAGVVSNQTSTLFTSDSRVWSVAPGLTQPITGVFTTKEKVARARAAHDEAVARYRQSVLAGIKDVETSLTQIRYRREQQSAQAEAVASALKATGLERSRYNNGTVSYPEFLDAERTGLALELQSPRLKAMSFIATVRLIKALGGGW